MAAKHRRRSLRTLALTAGLMSGLVAAALVTVVNAASAQGGGTWHRISPEIRSEISPDTRGEISPDNPSGPTTAGAALSGVRTLSASAGTVPGTWVVFTLNGPGRMVRADAAAPFQVTFDTRKLPNGAYSFSVMVLVPHRMPVVTTRVLRIVNRPAAAPPAAAPGRPPAASPPPASTTPPAPDPPAPDPPVAAPPGTSGFVAEVVSRTNAERAKNGCGALRVNPVLTSVAQAHSADMAQQDYFSHDSQNGASPFDRMTAAGYRFSTAGENIAAGQDSPAAVMTGWMNSPGHRANILNCAFTEIGVGFVTSATSRYPTYWTQDFATPR